jgi:hypothetical protein
MNTSPERAAQQLCRPFRARFAPIPFPGLAPWALLCRAFSAEIVAEKTRNQTIVVTENSVFSVAYLFSFFELELLFLRWTKGF